MPPGHDEMLKQTYALVKENNRMLHSMRRNAFLGGIFKLLMWAAFIIVPAYVYYIYLAPVMTSALAAMEAAQKSGAQVQTQFIDLQNTLKKLQANIPSLPNITFPK